MNCRATYRVRFWGGQLAMRSVEPDRANIYVSGSFPWLNRLMLCPAPPPYL